MAEPDFEGFDVRPDSLGAHTGWNCFDYAVGIGSSNQDQAVIDRISLVEQAKEFITGDTEEAFLARALLAPEIKMSCTLFVSLDNPEDDGPPTFPKENTYYTEQLIQAYTDENSSAKFDEFCRRKDVCKYFLDGIYGKFEWFNSDRDATGMIDLVAMMHKTKISIYTPEGIQRSTDDYRDPLGNTPEKHVGLVYGNHFVALVPKVQAKAQIDYNDLPDTPQSAPVSDASSSEVPDSIGTRILSAAQTAARFILMPITVPYNYIRSGIFSIIYPAPSIHRGRRETPFGEYDGKVATNLRPELAKDKKNPFKMDMDACLVYQQGTTAYDPNKQYVIHCDGNATTYSHLLDFARMLTNRERDVILFDPPGIRQSPGNTNGPEDYMRALKCMIEHLHERGIPYENITLSGQSLGAAIATMVACDYQLEGHRVKLINGRSFGNMAGAAASIVKNIIPTALLRATVGNLLYLLVNGAVRLFGLNFSPAKAFKKINELNPGDAVCFAAEGDQMIRYNQSLMAQLPTKMRAEQGTMYASDDTSYDEHNIPLEWLNSENNKNCLDDMFENLDMFAPPTDNSFSVMSEAQFQIEKLKEIMDILTSMQTLDMNAMTREDIVQQQQLLGNNCLLSKSSRHLKEDLAKMGQNTDADQSLVSFVQELLELSKVITNTVAATHDKLTTAAKNNKTPILFRGGPAKVKPSISTAELISKKDLETINISLRVLSTRMRV